MVFLNRGDRFVPVLMPREAQWAPAFGINIADFDGDGMEDVFLSQNFFAMRPEEPRLDSGRGLLLRGQGDGKLAAVPGQESGIIVYGEQRGSAVADFDEDGRTDLVVTQNRSVTQLLRNEGGKPGLRVRLRGPSGNPDAIGAVLRLHFGDRVGPAREIHAGSGYLSQDSAIQVMGTAHAPTAITVRWPGGATTTSELSRAAKEVAISAEGKLEVLR
jgi:hypothetical protein